MWHQDFGLGYITAGLSIQSIGNLARTHRPEQFALVTGIHFDSQACPFNLRGTCLRRSNLYIVRRQQIGLALFKFRQVCLGRRNCLALRKEEVASVARFHTGSITNLSQFADFFQQDNVHVIFLIFLMASRAALQP